MILIKNPFASTQKVAVSKLYIICLLFFVVFGCSSYDDTCDESEMPSSPMGSLDCKISTFMEGVSMYSEDSNVYIIKGIALDVYKYGRNIKFVEDLKGNFPKDVDTFIVWGADDAFHYVNLELNRMDNLALYDNQDNLIMLLTHSNYLPSDPESIWFEKPEDYTTLTCTFSVLRLSDGYVTGCLIPADGFDYVKQTMSWNDFQKELQKLLKSK